MGVAASSRLMARSMAARAGSSPGKMAAGYPSKLTCASSSRSSVVSVGEACTAGSRSRVRRRKRRRGGERRQAAPTAVSWEWWNGGFTLLNGHPLTLLPALQTCRRSLPRAGRLQVVGAALGRQACWQVAAMIADIANLR